MTAANDTPAVAVDVVETRHHFFKGHCLCVYAPHVRDLLDRLATVEEALKAAREEATSADEFCEKQAASIYVWRNSALRAEARLRAAEQERDAERQRAETAEAALSAVEAAMNALPVTMRSLPLEQWPGEIWREASQRIAHAEAARDAALVEAADARAALAAAQHQIVMQGATINRHANALAESERRAGALAATVRAIGPSYHTLRGHGGAWEDCRTLDCLGTRAALARAGDGAGA